MRLLPDVRAAHEGEEEAQVEHEARHDGEAEEAGIAVSVKPENKVSGKFVGNYVTSKIPNPLT